jgi:hypothetical protein
MEKKIALMSDELEWWRSRGEIDMLESRGLPHELTRQGSIAYHVSSWQSLSVAYAAQQE